MTNMFLKRVAKLLDGLPMTGYSETCKSLRGSGRNIEPRKEVPSEFELHTQVLHNTWGRIEFEIEPLTQAAVERPIKREKTPEQTEIDYRAMVKALQKQSNEISMQPSVDSRTISMETRSVDPMQTPSRGRVQVQEKPTPAEMEEGKLVSKEQIQVQTEKRTVPNTEQKHREFNFRESQRMLTLISQRRANAEILKQKSGFFNFSLPVLGTLARSPQTPKSALKWLAFHENPSIRKAIAKNKNTDLDILEILAHDEDEAIRLAVAENPSVNKEFLLRLLNDDMSVVVDKAKKILDQMTRLQANENNVATLDALSELVDSGETTGKNPVVTSDGDFLKIVASKANTPSQRLSQLSKHDDWNVRVAVAGNPSATIRTLSRLAQDPVSIVRNRVIANCNCPPEVILNTIGN